MPVKKTGIGGDKFVISTPDKSQQGQLVEALIIEKPLDGTLRFNSVAQDLVTSPQNFYEYVESLNVVVQSIRADFPSP